MPATPPDPRWPKLLSLSVHEFRTPLTVIAGYVRMLLKDRAGPLNDKQRKLLEETEKSCARLSALLTEISDLAGLEAGSATFNRQKVDLRELLNTAVKQLAPLPDREVAVAVQTEQGPAPIDADPARLALAFTSVISAVRREIVSDEQLSIREARTRNGSPAHRIVIGDRETIEAIETSEADLPEFDEWRGGCGLSLGVARCVINAHGGSIWSPPDGRTAGALIVLPATDLHG